MSRRKVKWRWVGGVFFNNYDGSGTSFEFAPGLTENTEYFAGVLRVFAVSCGVI